MILVAFSNFNESMILQLSAASTSIVQLKAIFQPAHSSSSRTNVREDECRHLELAFLLVNNQAYYFRLLLPRSPVLHRDHFSLLRKKMARIFLAISIYIKERNL